MLEQLSYLHGAPAARGILKAEASDFVVVEDLGFEPCGEGEHIFVRVRKTGENTAWVAGLLLDVLLGSTLGVRAMAMAITTYLAAFQFQKIRNFSLWQQALIIGLLSLVGKITVFWAEHLFSRASLNFAYFWSTLTTMLIWPWIFMVLRKVRRRFNIK